jgi:hypothetical protein
MLLLLKVVCEQCLEKVSLVKSFRDLELKLICVPCVLFSQRPCSNVITDGVKHNNTGTESCILTEVQFMMGREINFPMMGKSNPIIDILFKYSMV